MATTPVFLAFAGGAPASEPWGRIGQRAAPDRMSIPWHGPDPSGTPSPSPPIDERNPWAGVMAMRLRRAAMAIAI
jgi:hypothetical protein